LKRLGRFESCPAVDVNMTGAAIAFETVGSF
jgi:hypothetical protein